MRRLSAAAVVSPAQGHKKHALVQELACRRLAELTSNDLDAAAAARATSLPDILAAMRAHPQSAEVQAQACAALKYVADGGGGAAPSGASLPVEKEVVAAAAAAAMEHRQRPEVLVQAYGAIAAAATCGASVQSEAIKLGVLSEVAALCKPEAGAGARLLEAAFWAVRALVVGNSYTSRTAQSMGLLSAMSRAAELHASAAALEGLVAAVRSAVGGLLLAGVVNGGSGDAGAVGGDDGQPAEESAAA